MDFTPYNNQLQQVQDTARMDCTNTLARFYVYYLRTCVYLKIDLRTDDIKLAQWEVIMQHRGSAASVKDAICFVEGVVNCHLEEMLSMTTAPNKVILAVYIPKHYYDNRIYFREIKQDVDAALKQTLPASVSCTVFYDTYENLLQQNRQRIATFTSKSLAQ